MSIPTEEDVLAMAVLCAIVNDPDDRSWDFALEEMIYVFSTDPPGLADRLRPPGVLEIARSRRRDARPWAAVVAESEHQLEAEQAEQEVLSVVRNLSYTWAQRERFLDQDPTPDEVLRWAWTQLHEAVR